MVGKYKVITLCGSTKFKDEFLIEQKRLTLEGNIVISVGLFGHSGDDEVWTENIKKMLDDMHKRKIDMADEMAEIMKVDFDIVDEETKISYNKVLSKADASIRIMYLTEDNRINTATTKIPIMGFVDMQNVNENCECEVQNSLNNLIVKPNSNEEHSIAIEADIDITCLAYETKQINMIEDLYSITKDITFTKREVNAVIERNRITDMYTAKENIRIPEVTGRVLDVQIAPTINNMQVRNCLLYTSDAADE